MYLELIAIAALIGATFGIGGTVLSFALPGTALISSNQVRGFRRVSTIPITADNQTLQVDLPRGPHIEAVLVRVSGTFSVGTTYTTVLELAPTQLVRRIDWVVNGSVTLDSLSGLMAYINPFRRGLPTLTPPVSAAVGAKTIDGAFFLDRAQMDGARAKDSLLKTDFGVTTNQLRIQMGSLNDLFTGAGASTYTAVNVEVWVCDYQEARDKNGNTPSPLYYLKRSAQDYSLTATNANFQIRLSTGNRLRAIVARVSDSGVGVATLAGVINNVRLSRGGDTRVDCPAVLQRFMNQTAYGIALPNGCFVVDLANEGQLNGARYSEFWPIPSTADTYLTLDVTGAASRALQIYTLEGVDLPH
ncbi:MAG: hypothetical protein ACREUQ_07420 [Burkholderiales bacterium]